MKSGPGQWCGARPRAVIHGVCWVVVREGGTIESGGRRAAGNVALGRSAGSACLPGYQPETQAGLGLLHGPAADCVPHQLPPCIMTPSADGGLGCEDPGQARAPRGQR